MKTLSIAFVTALCIVVVWHHEAPPVQADQPLVAVPSGDLLGIQQRHEELVTRALDDLSAIGRGQAVAPNTRGDRACSTEIDEAAGEEWPADYPRTASNLARVFMRMPGTVNAESLVRHARLNVADARVSRDAMGELRVLVEAYKKHLRPLMASYADAKARELMSIAYRGEVAPVEVAQLPDEELAVLAKMHAKLAVQKGHPERTEAVILDELRRLPSAPKGIDHMVHNGKVYYHSHFAQLPVADSIHELNKFFLMEFMAGVFGWFEARGLCRYADVCDYVEEAAVFTAAAHRAANRRVGK